MSSDPNAAWCPECKRLFEVFAEADCVWQNLVSDLESASAAQDRDDWSRLQILAEAAWRACQHAKDSFIRHRGEHHPARLRAA